MDLEAISGAATVALTSTIVFLAIVKTWTLFSRTIASTPSFSDRIMHEAAQRFRDELDRLTTSQASYLTAALVFVMLFIAAYVLQAQQLFSGYPSWQLYLQLGFLGVVTIYAAFRLARTFLKRRDVKFMRDASVAVGHQLHQLTSEGTRVFHDVATSAGIVDHVIVGQKAIYAVNVVARRHRRKAYARLRGHELEFSDNSPELPIVDIIAKTTRLQKEFRELLGQKLRLRSVIAIPGWDIGEQASDDHLLVNERNIAMITGWRDKTDYLMNEDVTALQKELTERCAHH